MGLTQQWDLPNGGFIEGRVATHYDHLLGLFRAFTGTAETVLYKKQTFRLTYHLPTNGWRVGLWSRTSRHGDARNARHDQRIWSSDLVSWISPDLRPQARFTNLINPIFPYVQ